MRVLVEIAQERGAADGHTLDELEREVAEMDSLIGELLASSRLDFDALSLRELDGNDLAKRAAERAALDPAVLCLEGGSAMFQGDASLIGRAIANLIDNAEKHAGGVVTLRVSHSVDGLAFEVDDRGPGIPEAAVKRIFEPFERDVHATRKDHSTLGLGLSLVRRIATAHGGDAYAQNLAGGGARVGFWVREKG